MATDYAKATGGAGKLIIRDHESLVEFWITCTDGQTRFTNIGWSGFVNGTNVGGTVTVAAGFGSRLVASYTVSTPQTVTFAIAATGTWGVGGPTSHSAAIPRTTAPPAPTPVATTPDQITSNSMRYQFSGNGDGGSAIIRWECQYSTSPTFASGNSALITSNGTSVFEELTRGTTYSMRSRGVNAKGAGAWSAVKSGTTLHTIPDTPPAPAVTPAAKSIDWTAGNPGYVGAGVTEREVQISTSSSFDFILATSGMGAGTFGNLARGTGYRIRQRVRNAIGWSAWSVTRTVTTLFEPPTAPTGYSAYDISSTSAYVTGGAIADNGGVIPSDQRVQVNTSPTDVGATVFTSGYWGSTPLTGLVKSTTYHYRVAAYNAGAGGGWGPYGAWQSFTTKSNVPGPPTNLAASNITDFTALLTWALPAELNGATITSVSLRVAKDRAFATGLQSFSLAPNTTSQALGALTAATKYYAQVWTNTGNGIGASSAIYEFTTTGSGTAPKPLWMKIAGVWRQVQPWVKVDGVWRPAIAWLKVNGVWRQG